jgi:hypothetical protein
MRLTICLGAALILCAVSSQADARVRHHAAKPAAFQINETSWAFIDKKMKVRETIDKDGNYIENAVSGKHIDHGTVVMKNSKVCFTSAMTNEGEMCWTAPRTVLKIGQSFVAKSDKGEKLRVTRIKYTPLKMPS